MSYWKDTKEAADFIATADSRETSLEIMEAIAFLAHDLASAVELWESADFTFEYAVEDFLKIVTCGGKYEPTDFFWGASGRDWLRNVRGAE